jgi:prepilin-type N-terminal cleavage/methylation domain-containing protein
MLARLRRDESGFGLIELLIAMMVLSIGLLAVVAGFTSGTFTLQRAAKVATASAIADAQMERYRALRYTALTLTQASVDATPVGGNYRTDSAIGGDVTKLYTEAACPSGAPAEACTASRATTGPDGRQYRVDTYIFKGVQTADAGTSAPAREVKVVTIVVRDELDGMKTLIREQSTFDLATGR